jgi:AraC-like DNA-binding protein
LVAAQYFQPLTVSVAAAACRMLPFKFGRQFKETYGMDFRDYVVRFRIREACRLLRNPDAQISEVGYAVGFSEPAYFTKTFKKLIGVPPSHVVGNQALAYEFMEEGKQESKTSSRKS